MTCPSRWTATPHGVTGRSAHSPRGQCARLLPAGDSLGASPGQRQLGLPGVRDLQVGGVDGAGSSRARLRRAGARREGIRKGRDGDRCWDHDRREESRSGLCRDRHEERGGVHGWKNSDQRQRWVAGALLGFKQELSKDRGVPSSAPVASCTPGGTELGVERR